MGGQGALTGMLGSAADALPRARNLLLPAQEYYEVIESESDSDGSGSGGSTETNFSKLGTFAWLACAIALVEVLVSVKFCKGCACPLI